MKATLKGITEHGLTADITFEVAVRDLKDFPEECDLTVKKWRSQRSRDALNYSWQIITNMAEVLQMNKDEVYKRLVNDYGELERDEEGQIVKIVLKSSVEPMDIDLYLHWTPHTTVIDGTEYRLYWVVKPPHTYNTQEFARFLDHIKDEAIQIGASV